MRFHERLKLLRINSGITQKELSVRTGVSLTTVRNWETGLKQPSMSAVISLSEVLGVSADLLLGIDGGDVRYPVDRDESVLLLNYRSLDSHGKKAVDAVCRIEKSRLEEMHSSPVAARYIPKYLTPSAAGYAAPLDGEDFEMLLADESVPKNADFAVRIQGDSMSPYICDGDTVFVRKQYELSVGDVGIFSVDGAMYCKIYYVDSDRNMTLVSANPDLKDSNVYIDAESSSTVVCCGKVLLPRRIPFPKYFKEKKE